MKPEKKKRISAGILFYRMQDGKLEVLIAHPGGPLYARKNEGYWSIPKGEPDEADQSLLETAIREAEEETGIKPTGDFISLGSIMQKGGKEVFAWGVQYTGVDEPVIKSNFFEMEFPPKSGRIQKYPEIDRALFFSIDDARKNLKTAQIDFIDRLADHLKQAV